MKYLPIFFFALLIFAACQQDEMANWQPVSLESHGIAVDILVPDTAHLEIKESDLGIMKDITVQAGEGYSLQIFASDAGTSNLKQAVEAQKKEVASQPLFDKIIEEYEDGFLFQNSIDSTTQSFDFRKVLLKGDKEYIFRTGMLGIFTEDQARNMYKSIE
ncbi:MAG TPA: hypothetical protein ENJ88_05575 [Phaeodactylibacter sp.]|nr:hypothetical protein [Phaeodactylibacter sp.]